MDDIQFLTPEHSASYGMAGIGELAKYLHINRKSIVFLPAGGIDSWGEAPDDKKIETMAQQEIDTGCKQVDNWFKQYARDIKFTRDGFK